MEADRRKKKEQKDLRELEKERVRSFWNQVKVKEKKRRGCTNMGIRVWLTKCKRKKKRKIKRRKRMDERKGKEEEITI